MAKFDLKKAILENKATFFGSLTEGQFSWMTQDTGQQIGSEEENMIPVYMFDDKGKYYYEKNYDGYGVFGGMDYYELLDKMNGGKGDRSRGIDLAFDKVKTDSEILFPALVTRPNEFDYTTHDFTKEAKHDPNQSWYAAEEDEDFIDQNDEEVYGYDDEDEENEEELEEGYMGQFYAPEYLEQKYGKEMASKIEAEIEEMDENSYDRFTGMESAEEVENYISDIKDMLNLNELKTTNTKMKMSEFKAKIKEMVLAEMNLDVTDETSGYDFLAEIEGMLDEEDGLTPLQDYIYQYEIEISGEDRAQEFLDDIRKLNTPDDVYNYYAYDRDWSGSMDDDLENIYRQVKRKFKNLEEAKKDEEVADEEIEVTDEFSTEEPQGPGGIDVAQNADADLTGDKKDVQDNLEAALEAAKALGDDKLATQIGNSLTFFTKQHVVKEDLNEDENLTESKYKKGDMLQTYGGEEEVTVIDIKSNLAAALADTENLKAVGLLKQNLRQNLIDDEDKNKPFYLVTSNSFPEDMYYVESELKSSINESMFPMLKKILK